MRTPETLSAPRLAELEGLPLTGAPDRARVFTRSTVLPRTVDFDHAAELLLGWQVQMRAGLSVAASTPAVAVGSVADLLLGIRPVRVRAPVRVVSVVDDDRRRGFSYATLPGHPEAGEESFLLQRNNGDIEFVITATSAPALWWSRAAGPLGRLIQSAVTSRYLRTLDRP